MVLVIPVRFVMRYREDLPKYSNMISIGFHLAKAIGKHFDCTSIINNFNMSYGESQAFDEYVANMLNSLSQDLFKLINGQEIKYKVSDLNRIYSLYSS